MQPSYADVERQKQQSPQHKRFPYLARAMTDRPPVEEIHVDMPVECSIEEVEPGYKLPMFRRVR